MFIYHKKINLPLIKVKNISFCIHKINNEKHLGLLKVLEMTNFINFCSCL